MVCLARSFVSRGWLFFLCVPMLASAITLCELMCCVRRGPAGVSPQSAAVYADATRHPAEPKLAANNSLADPSEQSSTTPGQ